jgi:excisionase family DNA binding protein
MNTIILPTDSSASDVLGDGTLTIEQAIAFSGLPRTNLYEFMGRGELVYTKVGKRRLIPKRALVELLRQRLTSSNTS